MRNLALEQHAWGEGPNNLLRAVRKEDLALLAPALERWHGERDQLIYEPGDTVRHVYFPCGPSLISYLVILEDGRAIETALVGREGAAGGIISQGEIPSYARAEVQFPGEFLRIETAALDAAKEKSPTLRHLLARYAECLVAHIFQTVACNAAHSIDQRAARWLISAMDRTGHHEIPLTQDQMSSMMGVGRTYISRTIQAFKGGGLLETKRGRLVVRDLKGLRAIACACNSAIRRHYDSVLLGSYPIDRTGTEKQPRVARGIAK